MSVGSRIKELREHRDLTRNDLAQKIGVTPGAISNYENGISSPKIEILFKIMDVLECDANYLYQDDMEAKPVIFTTTLKEQDFLKKYRELPPHSQGAVDNCLNYEHKYHKLKEKERILSNAEESVDLPLFYLPASAGGGAFLDSDDYELYRFPSKIVPFGTTFALRVRGDSMEPVFSDGDIVFVKQQPTLENGQIGIFILNGEGFIKKFHQGEDGYTLISKNPEYEDIFVKENDDIRIVGRVLRKYNS